MPLPDIEFPSRRETGARLSVRLIGPPHRSRRVAGFLHVDGQLFGRLVGGRTADFQIAPGLRRVSFRVGRAANRRRIPWPISDERPLEVEPGHASA